MIKNIGWRIVALLILVALLVAGGFALHYVGWTGGYESGQAAECEDEAAAPDYVPEDVDVYLRHSPFSTYRYGLVSLLCRGVFLLLLFAGIVKLVSFIIFGSHWGFGMMRMHRWPGPRSYRRHMRRMHRRWAHGPYGGWWWGPWDEEDEETDAEPDSEQ